MFIAGAFCVCLVALQLYSPAIDGRFLFDDISLPFHKDIAHEPLRAWMSTVRPLLMFTYWVNYSLSGMASDAYHLTNVAIHIFNVCLVFLVLLRIFNWTGWTGKESRLGALVGAAIFLVHPLQTESVSYIAGRSESLAASFALASYAVFLYRRAPAISWLESGAVLLLFGLAVATKENAVALAGVFLLTDLFWPGDGWRAQLWRNRRLYGLMAPCVLAALVAVSRVLANSPSAGFSIPGVTWYQYGFTQARAIFVYIRLFLLPVGQSVDHDFALSHSITEHGAIFFLAALALLAGAAIAWRRQFRLEAFGLLMFLTLLAPTSSIVPISDSLVERRMYLPILGLILIASGIIRRAKPRPAIAAVVIGVFLLCNMVLCYRRNQLWGDPVRFWTETVQDGPHNWRPYGNLAETFISEHRCKEALPYLQRAQVLLPGNARVEESLARVLECVGRRAEAIEWLRRAVVADPRSRVYEWIGLLYGEMGQSEESGRALKRAVDLEFRSVTAHDALALWYESVGQANAALTEYHSSLGLDPDDSAAKRAIMRLEQTPR
jgi:protein O-mannosyl-transferase